MMKSVLVASASLAMLLAASSASATQFAGPYTVNANVRDPGLVVRTDNLSPLSFNLDDGNSTTVALFNISTREADVGADDLVGKAISVDFSFLTPSAATGSVGGTTVGQRTLFGVFQNGSLHWNNSASIDFGSKGVLTVALNDVTFGNGFFGLSSTPATVYGTFSFAGASAGAVPEPASWAMMLVGFGAVGAVVRRRRVALRFG
jgi:hypothetical protein